MLSFKLKNMQVVKEEPHLTKDNSPDGILAVGGSKDSIFSVQELAQKSKDDISVPSTSFLERSYSVHSFSISNELQICGEGGGTSKYLWCLQPLISFFSGRLGSGRRNRKGNRTSWEIPSDRVYGLSHIGSGAHGNVFRGTLYNEVVAVKEVRGELKTNIKLLKKLKHPNIVKMKGICTDSVYLRIVMEYCPFGNLYNELSSGYGISPGKMLNWAVQIAEGMNYLHKHKVIHRDLKSPNILISYNDVLKISDFGTSCRWDGFSTEMSCTGTYRWMAPEVIRNELCSEKVDIWSYGVVLWEMLTSEVPYKKLEALQVMYGVGNNSLHLHVPQTFPQCFKYLLGRCWSRKPNDRPSFQSILKHLTLKTTEKEMNGLYVGFYHNLQRDWKLEISSKHGEKNFSSSTSSISEDQAGRSAEFVLQMYENMKTMYDVICYKEQQILKREHDLQTKMESLSQLCLDQAHGCLRSRSEHSERCCLQAIKDTVLKCENVPCHSSRALRTSCCAAVRRPHARSKNELHRDSFGGSLLCNNCSAYCRGSLNNLNRGVRSLSTPDLDVLARIPESAEMSVSCNCQQLQTTDHCVQKSKQGGQSRVKFQESGSCGSIHDSKADEMLRARCPQVMFPKSNSNQSSLSGCSSYEENTSEYTCSHNSHEFLSSISDEDVLKSAVFACGIKRKMPKPNRVSFNISTSSVNN